SDSKKKRMAVISDFGLARNLAEGHSEGKTAAAGGVPIAWMSPESLKEKSYSEKSDVWSFGILLVEIERGGDPYPGVDVWELAPQIMNEFRRPDIPIDANSLTREIILMCLEASPADRPTFQELLEYIQTELDDSE